MKTVTKPARQVPVIAEVDVLVVGSGPGGLAASLAAARAGVSTMVVERFGCLGGNITAVGVESIEISHASVRSVMCCTVIGQGAGVAAAVAVKDGTRVRDVNVARVQEELRRQGVRLH